VPNLCPFHIIASRICYTAKYGALYICSVYIDSFPHTKKLDLEFEICYTFVFLIFDSCLLIYLLLDLRSRGIIDFKFS
jgi:hypothetical protein